MTTPVTPMGLRLGNIVFKQLSGSSEDVLQITKLSIEVGSGNGSVFAQANGLTQVYGIPLNDRILLWLGFVKDSDGRFWIFENTFKLSVGYNGTYNLDGESVSSIHELQNLIFWKQRFELIIDISKKPLTF